MPNHQHDWKVRRFGVQHFEHPTSEADLIALVQQARNAGAQLRFRGSAHSVAAAVYTDNFDPETGPTQLPGSPVINVMLDGYRDMHFFESGGVDFVTLDAGRNIGSDPYGPDPVHEDGQGFVHALAARKLAVPVLGGISHQTISGFMSTGSAGASVQYGFHQAIESIRIIDGTGTAHDIDKADPRFPHVGLSLGLLGVISKVTLRLEPEYALRGWTSVQRVGDCEIDLFGDGDATRRSLRQFFEDEPYSRLLYWPQEDVQRVEIWQAERMPVPANFVPEPYRQFEDLPLLQQWLIRALYTRILPQIDLLPGDADAAAAEQWLRDTIQDAFAAMGAPIPALTGPIVDPFIDVVSDTLAGADAAAGEVKKSFVTTIINAVIALTEDPAGGYTHRPFTDTWYEGLPHDNQMDDQLMPVLFTELWMPIDKTPEIMRALRDHWAEGSLARTGTFAVEVYAAPASPFTLSAAKGTPVLRIDPFVFWRDDATPEQDYFPQYWELLKDFGARFHWGKSLSDPGSSTGVSYRRTQAGATDWDAFKALRDVMDPDEIFLTSYWRAHLGL